MADTETAPELDTVQWFNSDRPLRLADLRGKVVVIHAFQMLCPGCVSHGLPQAQMIYRTFSPDDVQVIGLHTVFEHHDAMTPVSLAAFLHEYRVDFPVGVDRPGSQGPIPHTMHAFGMQGTPTLILIDRQGRVRKHGFGREPDVAIGAEIMALVLERAAEAPGLRRDGAAAAAAGEVAAGCAEGGVCTS